MHASMLKSLDSVHVEHILLKENVVRPQENYEVHMENHPPSSLNSRHKTDLRRKLQVIKNNEQ